MVGRRFWVPEFAGSIPAFSTAALGAFAASKKPEAAFLFEVTMFSQLLTFRRWLKLYATVFAMGCIVAGMVLFAVRSFGVTAHVREPALFCACGIATDSVLLLAAMAHRDVSTDEWFRGIWVWAGIVIVCAVVLLVMGAP